MQSLLSKSPRGVRAIRHTKFLNVYQQWRVYFPFHQIRTTSGTSKPWPLNLQNNNYRTPLCLPMAQELERRWDVSNARRILHQNSTPILNLQRYVFVHPLLRVIHANIQVRIRHIRNLRFSSARSVLDTLLNPYVTQSLSSSSSSPVLNSIVYFSIDEMDGPLPIGRLTLRKDYMPQQKM